MASIKKFYFNPRFRGSFGGLHEFFQARKPLFTRKQAESELLKLPAYFRFRPARKKINRRRVLVNLVNYQITFDLIDVQRWSKENNGFRYILIVLDSFSRKMYTQAIKDKRGNTLIMAMKKVLKQMPKLPRYANSDQGSEFIHKGFQEFLKSKGIIWFTNFSITKANMAER
jgi:transposase InsO family protein